MFERKEPPQIDENELKALQFLDLAKIAEHSDDLENAVKYYNEAFKLCPALKNKV